MAGAGGLRDRCAFQSEVNTSDGAGGNTVTWATQFTTRGRLLHERNREQREAGRLEAAAEASLKVRSSVAARAVTSEWRVLINEVPHQIRSPGVNRDRGNRWIWFDVEEGVAT